jgi:radical SAM superfamily enzyme YgiQ (UPF0313 family)
MKIALIEASVPAKKDRLFYPLGLAYCASYAKKLHDDLEIVICRDLEEVLEAEPHLAGISATSPAFPAAARACLAIKQELAIPVIMGGAHISGLPESLPPAFDAAVLGEGEATFAALIGLYRDTGRLDGADLAGLKGIAFHHARSVVVTSPAPPIGDLDSIPFPMREWKGVDSLMQWSFSSRGCPFRCIFCASSTIWKGYRSHSPGYVVQELQELVRRFGLSFCIFMDDLFAVDMKRVCALSALLRETLERPLNLTVTLRADSASPEMCALLREMGVTFVHLGLESGSDRVLRSLKCGTTSVQVNSRALHTCREAGLNAVGSFILGAPGEEEEDLDSTLRFIETHLGDGSMKSFSFSPMVPFPGTAVWDEAVRKGLMDPLTVDWESLDIDIRSFDGSRYLLLSDRVSRERFIYHVERVRELFPGKGGS